MIVENSGVQKSVCLCRFYRNGRIFPATFWHLRADRFTLSVLVVLPGYFLVFLLASKERAPRCYRLISRSWASVLFLLFGISVKVKTTRYRSRKTYVFAANHRSLLDIPSGVCNRLPEHIPLFIEGRIDQNPRHGVDYPKALHHRGPQRTRLPDYMAWTEWFNPCRQVSVFLCPEGTENKTNRPCSIFMTEHFA